MLHLFTLCIFHISYLCNYKSNNEKFPHNSFTSQQFKGFIIASADSWVLDCKLILIAYIETAYQWNESKVICFERMDLEMTSHCRVSTLPFQKRKEKMSKSKGCREMKKSQTAVSRLEGPWVLHHFLPHHVTANFDYTILQ